MNSQHVEREEQSTTASASVDDESAIVVAELAPAEPATVGTRARRIRAAPGIPFVLPGGVGHGVWGDRARPMIHLRGRRGAEHVTPLVAAMTLGYISRAGRSSFAALRRSASTFTLFRIDGHIVPSRARHPARPRRLGLPRRARGQRDRDGERPDLGPALGARAAYAARRRRRKRSGCRAGRWATARSGTSTSAPAAW